MPRRLPRRAVFVFIVVVMYPIAAWSGNVQPYAE
jgi:hypothetical protein